MYIHSHICLTCINTEKYTYRICCMYVLDVFTKYKIKLKSFTLMCTTYKQTLIYDWRKKKFLEGSEIFLLQKKWFSSDHHKNKTKSLNFYHPHTLLPFRLSLTKCVRKYMWSFRWGLSRKWHWIILDTYIG